MILRVAGRRLTVTEFERAEFKAERWRYRRGGHVTALAPTQSGKTTWLYELGEVSCSPKLPMLSLVMKPRDSVPTEALQRLGHPVLQSSPPPKWRRWRHGAVSGWGLWPKRTGKVRADNVMLQD